MDKHLVKTLGIYDYYFMRRDEENKIDLAEIVWAVNIDIFIDMLPI